MKNKSIISILTLSAAMALSSSLYADADGGHHHGHSGHHMSSDNSGKGHGHHGAKSEHKMREVMGEGRINKIMAKHGMVNIKHEPMPEMNWPQMSMNFKTQEQVDLSNLKPGQQVEFKLLVDDDNNYVIKEILVK